MNATLPCFLTNLHNTHTHSTLLMCIRQVS